MRESKCFDFYGTWILVPVLNSTSTKLKVGTGLGACGMCWYICVV